MSRHFPLFADLRDRPVLLVGAGHVAARKAEDLLRAGAQLRVVARELSPVFQDWLAAGHIAHLGAEFSAAQLDGVFLVVAATNDSELNARVFAAAEAAGKFCNVVDTPHCCSYIVPAVIDRAPLQIAISTRRYRAGTRPPLAAANRTAAAAPPRHAGEHRRTLAGAGQSGHTRHGRAAPLLGTPLCQPLRYPGCAKPPG